MSIAVKRGGKEIAPLRVVIYGPGGIGKSTFGASAPKPIFLCAEKGASELDVDFIEIESWKHLLSTLDDLAHEKHDYKTVVIDSLDWLEPMLFAKICDEAGVKNMEDVDYGKLYANVTPEIGLMLVKLERLQKATGMHVVMIAHSQVKTVNNTEGNNYDRLDLKLHESRNVKPGEKIKEWASAVLYACLETFVKTDKKTSKATTSGARVLKTSVSPAYYAKNRYSLPAALPLSWDDFFAAVQASRSLPVEDVQAELDTLMPELDETNRKKLVDALAANPGDAKFMAMCLNRVKALLADKE